MNIIINITFKGDSIAITLTVLFFFLVTHPEIMGRLVSEIDAAFETQRSNSETLDADWWNGSTEKLPFLEACINETLRMYPITPEYILSTLY
jgi:cytochrome P450